MPSVPLLAEGSADRCPHTYSMWLPNVLCYPSNSLLQICLIFTKMRNKKQLTKRPLLYMFAVVPKNIFMAIEKEKIEVEEQVENPATEEIVETTEVETTETPIESEGAETLRAFVETTYGKTFESDADFEAFVKEKLTESEESLSGYKDADSKVMEILDEYPELYAVVQDLIDGKPIEVALASNIDLEDITPLPDEDMYKQYEDAKNTRKERKAKVEAYRKEFDTNMEASRETIKEYFEEKAMTDEDATDYATFIDNHIAEYNRGIVTKEFLDLFYKARNYAKDVIEAEEQGAIKGKNAKVDAEREKKAVETDGMPVGGSSIGVKEATPEDDDVFSFVSRNSRRNRM